MPKRNFYHYTIWFEGDDGSRLNPSNCLNDNTFEDGLSIITRNDEKTYFLRSHMIQRGDFYGTITRTKNEEGFIRFNERFEMNRLADETSDEGFTGDINSSRVNFGLCFKETQLKILIEKGFRTPGINIFERYLKKNLDDDNIDKIKHRSGVPPLEDDEIEKLLQSELIRAEVSFKKYPEVPEDESARETLNGIFPEDYRLKFEARLETKDDAEEIETKDWMSQFLNTIGRDNQSIPNTIRQIDFPELMHKFEIEGITDEGKIEHNLAKIVHSVEIDTTGYELFDPDLGEKLCSEIGSA